MNEEQQEQSVTEKEIATMSKYMSIAFKMLPPHVMYEYSKYLVIYCKLLESDTKIVYKGKDLTFDNIVMFLDDILDDLKQYFKDEDTFYKFVGASTAAAALCYFSTNRLADGLDTIHSDMGGGDPTDAMGDAMLKANTF